MGDAPLDDEGIPGLDQLPGHPGHLRVWVGIATLLVVRSLKLPPKLGRHFHTADLGWTAVTVPPAPLWPAVLAACAARVGDQMNSAVDQYFMSRRM